ncbi:mismatch-specific thymine-DNA glycosylate [Apiospora rasikravindrae]|uniref:Mismatch-specific thymine-DNA glycosylate n=1 Tax=Apiospora rasikravindrae TaxID=990691 RepID=A0ABR1TC42_9PEZI
MDSEPQAVDEAPAVASQASFKGRLQLQDFMYKTSSANTSTPKSPAPIRRSPRHLSATPSSATTMAASLANPKSPAASPVRASSRKRKNPSTENGLLTAPSPAATGESLPSPPPEYPPLKKRARGPSTYAPPSTYAHLPPLIDILAPDLLVLFIGLNPGVQTARSGHAYAHPSNLFWKLLYSSRITPVPCRPEEDRTLPDRFGLGNTNIVARPSRNGAELSKAEMDDGVAVLEAKIRQYRPEVACVVGKGIWESVWRVRRGRNLRKQDGFAYGWQDVSENMGVVAPASEGGEDGFEGARVFVATSTSGLAATLRPSEKERIWKELGDWCEARRKEKGMKVEQDEGSP